MKQIDDNLEWHDENELVRRLDVVEAVLNLADTIDDVVDVIMSVPTYKVQTSTNVAMGSDSISTKAEHKDEPNSSEKPNNCEDDKCNNCIHMVFDGFWYCECRECHYEPKDEPQTDCAWK